MRESPAAPVTLAGVLLAVAVLASTGIFGGTPIWSPDSYRAIEALLSTAAIASAIWVVILAGIAGLIVWLWTSRGRSSNRARSVEWTLTAAIGLDALWFVFSVAGWVWPAAITLATLFVVLIVVNRQLDAAPPRDIVEKIVLDGTCGLHLGWIAMAFTAAIAQAIVHSGTRAGGLGNTIVAVVLLAGVVGLARLAIPRVRFFESVLIGILWGLVWLAVARLSGELTSVPVAISAFIAAAAIIVLWMVRDRDVPRRSRRPGTSRAQRLS